MSEQIAVELLASCRFGKRGDVLNIGTQISGGDARGLVRIGKAKYCNSKTKTKGKEANGG